MAREVHCVPADFDGLIMGEAARGNGGGRWINQPPSSPEYGFRNPLDLDAIRAEWELPDCIHTVERPDGSNSVYCVLNRVAVGGGPKPRGWLARRLQRQWWEKQEKEPRPRKVFARRDDA